ncbi:iron complex transport system ATP-binding protein [Kosakonia oryzendophytica]|uniref:Iron complex transport system ATP-binding protein n=1 Tax=Kosakonia oryzendophytica TaxID=1005665 RepID=A0A1C4BCG7_9ENTR|nr:ABC transporter ATP-binding protein [Kosakonia oryzendophytica]TDT60476.1 iron complex transport system ATP-binding protein [Enterobacter sp. AG5470]SCC04566.1 iron complex transport system ATP-binding protein [Kosakonia oryzendophytica]
MSLSTDKLSVSYQQQTVINALDLSLPAGRVSVLIGSNGCGKSTLLKAMARLLTPQSGRVILDGLDIHASATQQVAQKLAILPQTPIAPEGITVRQLVSLGRFPWQNWLRQWSEEDDQQVNEALRLTGTAALQHRPVDALSGGQRQRVWIAMTLAQGTGTLLLDEPTTYLDLAHQIEILELLRMLNRQQGKTIVMVLHDLNLACRYADHLVAVHDGRVYAQGAPQQIMSETLVQDVFNLRCRIIDDPFFHTPLCIPFPGELHAES